MGLDLEGLKMFSKKMDREQPGAEQGGERVIELPCDQIMPDPDQPRKEFDDESLQELADDIRRHGLIQPIVVRRSSAGQYVVVTGERRLRAYQKLGEPKIKAIVRDSYSAGELGYIQIAENIKRSDLKFYELADFIAAKVAAGASQKEVGEKLGLSASAVSRYMTWQEAPQFLKDAKEKLASVGAAADLVRLAAEEPEKTAQFVAEAEKLTEGAVRSFKKSLSEPEPAAVPAEAEESASEQSGDELSGSSWEDDSAADTETEDSSSTEEGGFAAEESSWNDGEADGSAEADGIAAEVEPETEDDCSPTDESSEEETDAAAWKEDSNSTEEADADAGTEDYSESSESSEDTEDQADESETDADSEQSGFEDEVQPEQSSKLKKPFIIGTVEGREGYLQYSRRPTADGLVWVQWDDGMEEEITAESFRINCITEA